VEQWPVETRYDSRFGTALSSRGFEVGGALAALPVADVITVYALGVVVELLLVLPLLGKCGRRFIASNFGDGEYGLPASYGTVVEDSCWISESGCNERALRPAVIDVGEVPVNGGWCSVFVKLVAHIDELLHRGDVDIVDSAKVKDDGVESWTVAMIRLGLAATWSWIVPWSVPKTWKIIGIGTACFGVNVVSQLIQVVVGIWVVESFRKSIDEYTWIWVLNINFGVGTVAVIQREKNVSGKRIIQPCFALWSGCLLNRLVVTTDKLIIEQ